MKHAKYQRHRALLGRTRNGYRNVAVESLESRQLFAVGMSPSLLEWHEGEAPAEISSSRETESATCFESSTPVQSEPPSSHEQARFQVLAVQENDWLVLQFDGTSMLSTQHRDYQLNVFFPSNLFQVHAGALNQTGQDFAGGTDWKVEDDQEDIDDNSVGAAPLPDAQDTTNGIATLRLISNWSGDLELIWTTAKGTAQDENRTGASNLYMVANRGSETNNRNWAGQSYWFHRNEEGQVQVSTEVLPAEKELPVTSNTPLTCNAIPLGPEADASTKGDRELPKPDKALDSSHKEPGVKITVQQMRKKDDGSNPQVIKTIELSLDRDCSPQQRKVKEEQPAVAYPWFASASAKPENGVPMMIAEGERHISGLAEATKLHAVDLLFLSVDDIESALDRDRHVSFDSGSGDFVPSENGYVAESFAMNEELSPSHAFLYASLGTVPLWGSVREDKVEQSSPEWSVDVAWEELLVEWGDIVAESPLTPVLLATVAMATLPDTTAKQEKKQTI
jgi:hypothetical protein